MMRLYSLDQDGYLKAALNVDIEGLDWLWSHQVSIPEEVRLSDGLFWSFEGAVIKKLGIGAVPVLEWLDVHGNPIGLGTALDASYIGNIEILEWLEKRRPPVLPDVESANLTAAAGNMRVLKWLAAQHSRFGPSSGRALWKHVEIVMGLRKSLPEEGLNLECCCCEEYFTR